MYALPSAERRFKQLFSHKAMQPRTFKKVFRASMGQRRFSLLFTCHSAPRRFSIKRRFHFGTVFILFAQSFTLDCGRNFDITLFFRSSQKRAKSTSQVCAQQRRGARPARNARCAWVERRHVVPLWGVGSWG